MGRKLKQKGHSPSIYFQIFDESKWEMIDRLMALPKYEKSRTSLINNALDYGLPKLIEQEFGEVTLQDEPTEVKKEVVESSQYQKDSLELQKEIIRLLSEILIYVTLDKAMLCGLYQAKETELHGRSIQAERFSHGLYNYTPNCLDGLEIELLKDLTNNMEKGR